MQWDAYCEATQFFQNNLIGVSNKSW
jgi:hypothetical protein